MDWVFPYDIEGHLVQRTSLSSQRITIDPIVPLISREGTISHTRQHQWLTSLNSSSHQLQRKTLSSNDLKDGTTYICAFPVLHWFQAVILVTDSPLMLNLTLKIWWKGLATCMPMPDLSVVSGNQECRTLQERKSLFNPSTLLALSDNNLEQIWKYHHVKAILK